MAINYNLLRKYAGTPTTVGVGGYNPQVTGQFSPLADLLGTGDAASQQDQLAILADRYAKAYGGGNQRGLEQPNAFQVPVADQVWGAGVLADPSGNGSAGNPFKPPGWDEQFLPPEQQVLAYGKRIGQNNIDLVNQYADYAPGAYDAAADDNNATRGYISNQQRNANLGYDSDDRETLGTLGTSFGQSARANSAALGNMQSEYDAYQPIQLGAAQFAGPSRAASAYADPGSIAAQNGFLSQLQGVAGGSLNGTSQAAGAYADPGSIAAQNQALSSLFAAAGGSLNVSSQGAQAYADPASIAGQNRALAAFQGMAGGSMDLESLAAEAGADPESIEAQHYALDKYKGLSDPTVTAEERFIMELARRNEEQDRKAALDAGLRDLEARGVRGSGAEVGAMLGSQQTTSQNRLLQDLGAEANAVQRSQQALAGYTGLANNIRGQSFAEDFNKRSAGDAMNVSNRDVRIRGVEDDASLSSTMRNQSFSEAYQRGIAADNVNTANANRQLNATGMAGDLASTQRGQSFNESFNRGAAADSMYNANANRQVQGMSLGAGLASDMRNSSFTEEFNRGQAADLTERFNVGIQNDWTVQAADLGLKNQAVRWGQTNDLLGATYGATSAADQRAAILANTGLSATNNSAARFSDYTAGQRSDADSLFRNQAGGIGLRGDILGMQTGANNQSFNNISTALNGVAAKNSADNAQRLIDKENGRWKGILGLDIGPGKAKLI